MELQGAVERWLTHGAYRFKNHDEEGAVFCSVIRHLGGFGNPVHIFEPAGQPGILVVGSKVPLKNAQNARYLRYNENERERFKTRIAEYCRSVRAVYKFHDENGKMLIGVYVVLDSKERLNGDSFLEAVGEAAQMGDDLAQFLARTV